MNLRPLLMLLSLWALLCTWPAGARAQSIDCTSAMSDIAFGTISLRSGEVHESAGTLTINCTGLGTVGVCIYFGAGTGGAGAGFSPRHMRRADNATLDYQLRPGGNGASGGVWTAAFVEVPTTFGSGSVNVPVYADILSTGVGTGTGSYATTFSGAAEARIEFNTNSCAQPGMARMMNAFTVSGTVSASCEVDAGALDFGTLGADISGPVDADTTFFMRCTQGTPYTVRLGNGMGAGATGPTDRRLTGPAAQLRYGLYLDVARTQPWGDTAGTGAAATGTGLDQGMTVHGRIFSGQPLIVGAYTDSVLITVEY